MNMILIDEVNAEMTYEVLLTLEKYNPIVVIEESEMSVQQELEALGHKFQKIKLGVAIAQREAAFEVPESDPERMERLDEWSEHVINTKKELNGYKSPLALPPAQIE